MGFDMSYKINLTQDEKIELESRMSEAKNSKIYRRLIAIKMKDEKLENKLIAKHLSVSGDTVRNWVKLFLSNGFSGLCHLDYEGKRKASKLEPYRLEIKEFLETKTIEKIAEIQNYMAENDNVTLSRWAFGKYIKKNLGYSYKKLD